MLTLPDGCKASTEQHIIQTSLRELGTFDMETETLKLDIEQLLDDDKVDGKILLDLMNAANDANEKLTIQDVKKKYQLKMITHHYATTSIWIYILTAILLIVIIGILICQVRKYRHRNQSSHVPNTYLNISTSGIPARQKTSTINKSFSVLLSNDSSISECNSSPAKIDKRV